MDVVKNLTFGLNLRGSLKNSELMNLKEENLKPLRNILSINKRKEVNVSEKIKRIIKACEEVIYEDFCKDEKLISSYMKANEINVEYVNLNRDIVPIRSFNDIVDCVRMGDTDSCHDVRNNRNIGEGHSVGSDRTVDEECKKVLSTVKNKLGFNNPTAIQKICIPAILSGCNTICISRTGSGKTFAFLIPLLLRLNRRNRSPGGSGGICGTGHGSGCAPVIRSLIMVPTVELATQIYEQAAILFKCFPRYVVVHLSKEDDVRDNMDVCVCTPLLLRYIIEKKKVSLAKCFYVVFDEVDKVFEVSFLVDVNRILKELQNKRTQKVFTTATLPGNIKSFLSTLCTNYAVVYMGKSINTINNNVKQELLYVNNEEEKFVVLKNVIKNKQVHIPVLIFVETITKAKNIFYNLRRCTVDMNMSSHFGLLTSDITKEERKIIFQKFQEGHLWYLICTDIMSRGIDVNGIETVINYDVCYDKYSYMHRIGRACRSDRKEGKAITFFTKENVPYMKDIVRFVKSSGTEVPPYLDNYPFKNSPRFKARVKVGNKRKDGKEVRKKRKDGKKLKDGKELKKIGKKLKDGKEVKKVGKKLKDGKEVKKVGKKLKDGKEVKKVGKKLKDGKEVKKVGKKLKDGKQVKKAAKKMEEKQKA
ncbi:RNA helicase, putative [Plasmodium ovale curtisi]|uniref:RNA helicase n=2 Tax=Plasmodium ovale curtisi TaxID=864141 RepID=A0A1A8VMB8_PLAOA|nr:RNA helicase, putative [Plasmodium ovale curtisi]